MSYPSKTTPESSGGFPLFSFAVHDDYLNSRNIIQKPPGIHNNLKKATEIETSRLADKTLVL